MGVLNRVEDKLEQADLPLRPPEALFLYIAIVVVSFVVSVYMFGPFIGLGVTVARDHRSRDVPRDAAQEAPAASSRPSSPTC